MPAMDQARHAVCQHLTVVAVTRVSTFLVLKQWVVAECCKSHSHAALPMSPAGGGGELVAEARSMQEGPRVAPEQQKGTSGMPIGMHRQEFGEQATQSPAVLTVSAAGIEVEVVAAARSMQQGTTGAPKQVNGISGMSVEKHRQFLEVGTAEASFDRFVTV